MILGHLFLLIVLLVTTLLVIAYAHYKSKRSLYKRRGYWDLSDIRYIDSVVSVFAYFIVFFTITALVFIIIINWNVPVL